jgi:hypothetical protein
MAMIRFKGYLAATLGCLMLTAVLAVFDRIDVRAQGGPPTRKVRVVNAESEPVPVRNIDDFAAKNAFSTEIGVTMEDGGSFCPASPLEAPAGKRFVIEHVSAHASLPVGQQLEDISLALVLANPPGVPSGQVNQFKELVPYQTAPGKFVSSQDLRTYADVIGISCLRSSAVGAAIARLSISGYLVDVP